MDSNEHDENLENKLEFLYACLHKNFALGDKVLPKLQGTLTDLTTVNHNYNLYKLDPTSEYLTIMRDTLMK
ncbi:MAG: hypothetical protein WCJ29_00760 [bacterium]